MPRIANLLVLLVVGVAMPGPRALGKPAAKGAPGALQQVPGGLLVRFGDGLLKLEVCAADVVRVAYAKDQAFFARKSLATQPKRCDGAKFDLTQDASTATLATSRLRVRVDLGTGRDRGRSG